jgi:hypothetical protein
MTDPGTPEPLAPDVVDELLSARADGQFDAAARDLGFTPAEAQARLDATPGSAERARALDEARGLVADVAPLDEVTQWRMIGAASEFAPLAELRRDSRRRRASRLASKVLAGAGIAAAAAAVVALLAIPLSNGGRDDDASSAGDAATAEFDTGAGTTAAANAAPPPPRVVEDEQALRAYARALAQQHGARSDGSSFGPSGEGAPSTDRQQQEAADGITSGSANAQLERQAQEAARTCISDLARGLDVEPDPLTWSQVRHRGAPAFVVVFANRDRNGVTAVLYREDCEILISATQFAS